MSSIIWNGRTYHGISADGRGVFTDGGWTYAGQHRDGYACGLAVVTDGVWTTYYAEHGPDGQYDGRYMEHFEQGHIFCTTYSLYERGKENDLAKVSDLGKCEYNGKDCAPDDPRFLALKALVAPVEVRPAAPNPQSSSTRPQAIVRCAGSFCTRRRSRTPKPPRCTPTLHAVAGGRATQLNTSRTAKHDHAVTRECHCARAGST
jgi:hypothetical protein